MLWDQTNFIFFCSSNPVKNATFVLKSNALPTDIMNVVYDTYSIALSHFQLILACHAANMDQNCHARPCRTILGYQRL